ncbi:hypothetical protein BJX68DRAFT_280055 [Aspergillus pseudodeflectus]|uniref:F-box domain-containing protein n=1 Tax=Aspergillus pseudodeflectus TaxID=176178 RepID=A0ABR4KU41_9EURO
MPRNLTELPAEIIHIITSYLPNSDIKTLRLTCKLLCNTVQLRLNRVFLSANPLNIAVFLAIANSETFRHGVDEIIWDDARFYNLPDAVPFNKPDKESGCLEWFVSQCKENIENRWMRKGPNIDRHIDRAKQIAAKSGMTMKQSWQYFQTLCQQQEDVIRLNKDAEALAYGLRRLPALKRVTITPAAHGWIFAPLYETPMIRAFPEGFNYPIPRGWPHISGGDLKPQPGRWEIEGVREEFRGFGIATRALAEYPYHQVSEFVLDVNGLDTGLDCSVFKEPCAEYNDFATLLGHPGFTRLDLALLVNTMGLHRWPSFHTTHLRRALSAAHALQHISLHTTVAPDPRAQPTPLRTVFPVKNWPSLRHFELSGLIVDKDDLVAFLATLPTRTLRSVHLGFLYFPEGRGSWRALLNDMRDKLDWRAAANEKDLAERRRRVRVTVGTPTRSYQIGHAVWIDEEVQAFLYGNGVNPFSLGSEDTISSGFGVVRDSFESVD